MESSILTELTPTATINVLLVLGFIITIYFKVFRPIAGNVLDSFWADKSYLYRRGMRGKIPEFNPRHERIMKLSFSAMIDLSIISLMVGSLIEAIGLPKLAEILSVAIVSWAFPLLLLLFIIVLLDLKRKV